MNKSLFAVFFCIGACVSMIQPVHAAYQLKNGKLIDAKDLPYTTVQEHFRLGQEALKKKEWDEAVRQFRIVSINFPSFTNYQDSLYLLGVAYYHLGDVDLANHKLSQYLKSQNNLKYFEDAMRYKLAIAHAFKSGAKKHLFNSEKLPCIISGTSTALEIYDEIIASLPNHELAAHALYAKADLLWEQDEMREAVETYQTLIKKFPKTELASNSYLKISKIYVHREKSEAQNSDLLALAQINLKRFKQDFPRDERLEKVQKDLAEMREVYAKGLYETGRFYERKKKPKASVLYYFTALHDYPDTHIAKKCQKRLKALDRYAKELQLDKNDHKNG